MGSSIPEMQTSIEDVYRKTYYEVLHHAITHRFDQDGYKVLCKLEELLCNAKSKLEDYSDVVQLYADDFNQERLATQLSILHSNESKRRCQTRRHCGIPAVS